jgi:hypothetical protein
VSKYKMDFKGSLVLYSYKCLYNVGYVMIQFSYEQCRDRYQLFEWKETTSESFRQQLD